MSVPELLGLVSRWMHIASAVTLAGGLVFAWLVLKPTNQLKLLEQFGQAVVVATIGLLASGLYNLLNKTHLPSGYHMVFGVKFLIALHVIAMAFLASRPNVDSAKRARMISGAAISAFAILLLSAYLRALQQ